MAFSAERVLSVVALLLRVKTLLLLLASLIIIAANKIYGPFEGVADPPNFTFRDVYAYQYLLSAAVIGCAYTLLVIPFAAIHVAQGKRVGATAFFIFTDVVFAILIATGAAGGLGLTVEIQRRSTLQDIGSEYDGFYKLIDTSCGLMLAAVVFMVVTLMVSVHSLSYS